MAEDLVFSGNKAEKYAQALAHIQALTAGEPDLTANLANITAVLHQAFGWWWTGFYKVDGEALVLGPFQGPVACTRIARGKGVCGTAWEQGATIVVPDVHQFPGHIACSSATNSEIVVPVHKNGEVIMVLDVDSIRLNDFDETDRQYLEQVAEIVSSLA